MQSLAALTDPKYKGRIAIYDYYLPVIGMAAMVLGKKTSDLTEADLPPIRDVLLKMKANAKLVGEVTASQTALATGEVDILVGGGEWVTAGLAKENPALDFSIPQGRRRAVVAVPRHVRGRKNKDLALKFIQYVLSPEGQARLATSSCYWGMPANSKAALTDEQKQILRFDEQPGFLTRSPALSGPGRRSRQEDAGCLDRDAAGQMSAPPSTSASAIRAAALALAGPACGRALLRAALRRHGGRQPSGPGRRQGQAGRRQLRQFFANPSYWQAMINSLEVTASSPSSRCCSPIPSPGSWRTGPRALAAAGADARGAAVLDVLCRSLLQLAAGARRKRRRQPRPDCGSASFARRCSSPTPGSPP